MKLILGSASPRRLELLAQIGVVVDQIIPADIDETPQKGERPKPYAVRMAATKSEAINASASDLILTADTIVSAGIRILGKPKSEGEAVEFLTLLSGRRHRVTTAVSLRKGDKIWSRNVTTYVKMKNLSDHEISAYIRSQEWQGKAGGYDLAGLMSKHATFFPNVAMIIRDTSRDTSSSESQLSVTHMSSCQSILLPPNYVLFLC